MGKQANTVVGLGQCSLDILGSLEQYPPVDSKCDLDKVLIQGGGPVATALVTLARLEVPGVFLGCVGDDDFGRRIVSGLEAEGLTAETCWSIRAPAVRFPLSLLKRMTVGVRFFAIAAAVGS